MSGIILVGFMGSGKSTVGKQLAEALHCEFIEMDQEIERKTNQTIPEIFALKDENFFRETEFQVLTESIQKKGVVATGGGVVTFDKSKALLTRESPVIYLKGHVDTLFSRIVNDQHNKRPLATDKTKQEIAEMVSQRETLYEEVATHTIMIDDLSVSDIVSIIMKEIKGRRL